VREERKAGEALEALAPGRIPLCRPSRAPHWPRPPAGTVWAQTRLCSKQEAMPASLQLALAALVLAGASFCQPCMAVGERWTSALGFTHHCKLAVLETRILLPSGWVPAVRPPARNPSTATQLICNCPAWLSTVVPSACGVLTHLSAMPHENMTAGLRTRSVGHRGICV